MICLLKPEAKMRHIMSVALAVLFLFPAPSRAQDPAPGVTSTVAVRHSADRPLRAALSRHAARLAVSSRRAAARQTTTRRRNWFARHPVLTGTIAGAGAGLVFVAAEGCSSSDYTC